MKLDRLTIGPKLVIAFGAMLAMMLATLIVYVDACQHARSRLVEVVRSYNPKLDIGLQVELAVTEMQGAQRGLMLSYAMKDPRAAEPYIRLYADSGKTIDSLMTELQPLMVSAEEREAVADIRRSRETWAPRFQKLVELCEAGQTDEAYNLRNENKVISAKMHATATALAKKQRAALDKAGVAADDTAAMANWTALFITLISLGLTSTILLGVRGLIGRIRRMVAELDQGAGQLASASAQLSSSSQVVAQGASQQAASIQETSRSAGQITVTTRQNADHSSNAAQLTGRAGETIAEANRSLDQMQSSMSEINSSCEQVGRIIKVVDEIAFQTNILALNAAVEAARAGEAGLGFAVVAEEVRNLAQRSAKAASETAGLIENSIAKSRDGRSHFDKVAAAIGKVTASATEIAALVNQIKAGSAQQAHDVQSIAQAIGSMESATQSSAAAAQESAAIGKEMSAQAETLNTVVRHLHAVVG